jgi:hypothetical protein
VKAARSADVGSNRCNLQFGNCIAKIIGKKVIASAACGLWRPMTRVRKFFVGLVMTWIFSACDSFNAGIAKQNWGMVRRCHPAWNALPATSFSTSTAMNTNLALDVQVFAELVGLRGAELEAYARRWGFAEILRATKK